MDTNENSVGPVIGTIIILGLIVLGGLYFWGERAKPATDTQGTTTASAPVVDEVTASIQSQSATDDTASIENDLNNTNTTTLDSQLNAS